MGLKKRTRALLGMVTTAATLAVAPGAAHAAIPVESSSRTVTMAMTRVGVDHAVAAAHGYQVRVDGNGVEYPFRPGSVYPDTTVPGDCGDSFVNFTHIDQWNHDTVIETGFDLAGGWPGAVYVQWDMSIVDRFGVSTRSWNDPAASVHVWKKTHYFRSGGSGVVTASVELGVATLWDGTLCFSGLPSDSAIL